MKTPEPSEEIGIKSDILFRSKRNKTIYYNPMSAKDLGDINCKIYQIYEDELKFITPKPSEEIVGIKYIILFL